MRRLLVLILAALVMAAVLSLPAFAADLKFGGQAYTRYYSTDNMRDGDDDVDDNGNGFYTRMRLYFTARQSENLKAVMKLELDSIWGDGRIGTVSADGGSDGRADAGSDGSANSGFEIKNAYLDFNLPNTPVVFLVGIIPVKIGSGIVFNDDTSGILAMGKFDPVKVALLYSRLNDNTQPTTETLTGLANAVQARTPATFNTSSDDWDLWGAQVAFAPMKELALTLGGSWVNTTFQNPNRDFNHYNLALDADYRTDLFSLYFTGAKNFGEVESSTGSDSDFKGWLISAGGTVNVAPVVIGLDFYFSPGDDDPDDDDIDTYVTVGGLDGRNTYNMDEVVFLGWFDDESATYSTFPGGGSFLNNVTGTGLTRSNSNKVLTNLWAIGAHVDFKPLDQTLVQVGGAYMQFVEDVVADPDGGKDDKLGTSLYLRVSQGIVDGLQLKAVFGYLFADDGFSPGKNDDDAYKFAAGVQWDW
jgi:hypothetical protein